MYGYKKNTAGQNIGFSLATLCGSPVTEASVSIYRSIDGGSQVSATGTVTDLGNGQYNFEMSQADTNGDEISFLFRATSALPLEKTIVTSSGSGGATLASFNFNRPERFFPFVVYGDYTRIAANGGATYISSSSSFWSVLAQSGTAVNSNFSANVAKQIVSLSGKGEVVTVVGPTAGGSETTQFTIEVDGVTWTSPAIAVVAGYRVGLASVPDPYVAGATLGVFSDAAIHGSIMSFDGTHTHFDNEILVPTFGMPQVLSSPRLAFEESCTISITHSANVTGTTNQERQSGVIYRALKTWT